MLASLRLPGATASRELGVSSVGTWQEPEPGDEVIGRGWWAVPGLVDAHAHLSADRLVTEPGRPEGIRRRAYACLERGTFLIVDKGWTDDAVVLTLTDMAPTSRPDFQAAARMIAVTDGYYPGFAVETDPGGLAESVAEMSSLGRGWVKLVGDWPRKGRGAVANFSEDDLKVAADVAHEAGCKVAIHTMAPEVASMAVRAGIDSIEHGLFLTADDLVFLGERGGAWVPTVLRMEAVMEMLGADSSGGRLIRRGLDNVEELMSQVPPDVFVLAGTDLATDPGDVGREVMALVRIGLEPWRAVAAATTTARDYLGRGAGFEIGDQADVVFFERDPLEDPSVLQSPAAVIRAGRRLA